MPDEFPEHARTVLDLDVGDLTPVEEPVCERCGRAAYECAGPEIDPGMPEKCCFIAGRREIWCRYDPIDPRGGYSLLPGRPRR